MKSSSLLTAGAVALVWLVGMPPTPAVAAQGVLRLAQEPVRVPLNRLLRKKPDVNETTGNQADDSAQDGSQNSGDDKQKTRKLHRRPPKVEPQPGTDVQNAPRTNEPPRRKLPTYGGGAAQPGTNAQNGSRTNELPRRKLPTYGGGAAQPGTNAQNAPRTNELPRRKPPANGGGAIQPRDNAQNGPRTNELPRQRPPVDLSLFRDRRPASELTDAELRQRIRLFEQMNNAQRRSLRRIVEAYRTELNRRIAAATGVDTGGLDANREAGRLLSDHRPAGRLGDDALRQRVSRTRTVLALPGLQPRFEARLRVLLARDRDELRSRVARAEPRRRDEPQPTTDRGRLRREMLQARDNRRRRLNDPSYRIVIPARPARPHRPLATIPLAEAYDADLMRQLTAPPAYPIERHYTIDEYRANPSLRTLMPGIEVDTVKFGFNEDFLREDEILKLDRIGEIMERIIAGNPDEVFLIEGHTDLVGDAAYNEDLSWRRAAAVRDALTQYFYIPPANIEIVGYGEQFPRIPTEFEEPENRRVTVRRITPILQGRN